MPPRRPLRAASAGVGVATAAMQDTPNDMRDQRTVKKQVQATRLASRQSIAKRAVTASVQSAISDAASKSTWGGEEVAQVEVAVANAAAQMSTQPKRKRSRPASVSSSVQPLQKNRRIANSNGPASIGTTAAAIEPDRVETLAALCEVVFTGRRLQRDDLSDEDGIINPLLLSDEEDTDEEAAVRDVFDKDVEIDHLLSDEDAVVCSDFEEDDGGGDGGLEFSADEFKEDNPRQMQVPAASMAASKSTVATNPAPLGGSNPLAIGNQPVLTPPLGRASRSRRTRTLDDMTSNEDRVAGIWYKHMFAENIRRQSGLWITSTEARKQLERIAAKVPITSFTVNNVIVARVCERNQNVLTAMWKVVSESTFLLDHGIDPKEKGPLVQTTAQWLLGPAGTDSTGFLELRCGKPLPLLQGQQPEQRQDLSNPVIYDIVAQVIYRLRTTALATLEWPVCYENTSEHHALAFGLIAHTFAAMRCVLGKLLHKGNKFSAEVYGPVVIKIMDRFYNGSYTTIIDVSSQCVWTSLAAWVGHKKLRQLTAGTGAASAEEAAEAALFGFET